MLIQLLRADITSLKVDAIVNPASAQLQRLSGVVLVREGNEIVEKETSEIGPVPVGNAIVTTGGNLLCKFVIHAVVPRVGEGDEDRKLHSATWSALEKAEELAIESVALPAMSTGAYGMPYERSARVMLGATIDFRQRARSLRRAVYCLFGAEPYQVFDRVLKELEA